MTGMDWLPVTGWPYEVSSTGLVRRVGSASGATVGGILTPMPRSNGYLGVTLSARPRSRAALIHALVCEAFHGPRPKGQQVRHLDGNMVNNRADNLAWGTAAENCADKVGHGTLKMGDCHYRTKVSEADYRVILDRWAEHPKGYGQTTKFIDEVMADHGVSKGFVEDAIYGRVRSTRIREERRAA